MITTALRRNGPLGLSRPQRGRGKVKGLKNNQESRTLTIANYSRGWGWKLACSLRSGTVLSRKVVGNIDIVNNVDNTFVAIRIMNEDKTRRIETIDRKDHQVHCTVYYRY